MSNLSAAELHRWSAWKAATDRVWTAVTAEIATATGLSAADFAVLTRVVELGEGSLRQQVLADELGWQRARLSRQLSRMVERGLVERCAAGGGVAVSVTPEGRRLVLRARHAHARAVRSALLDVVPSGVAAAFWSAVDRLGEAPAKVTRR